MEGGIKPALGCGDKAEGVRRLKLSIGEIVHDYHLFAYVILMSSN